MSTIVRPAVSTVATRAVKRFRGYLALMADLFPDPDALARRREAEDEGEINPNMCKECLEYPAVNAGRCFGCLSGRRQ